MGAAAVAAAKSLQSCPTLCNPQTAAHQAALSLGFSRQDHWSGLPFPSPVNACMLSRFSRDRLCGAARIKQKHCCYFVTKLCPILL